MASGEVFFDLSFCFLQLGWCLAVETSGWNLVVWDEVNGVVDAIWRGWDGRELFWECSWESFEEAVFEMGGKVCVC